MARVTSIQLRNVAFPPGPIDLHLPHDIVCAASGECGCSRVQTSVTRIDPATRKPVAEGRVQRFPRVVTLLAKGSKGDAVDGLHPSVLKAPDVVAAIARRAVLAGEMKAELAPAPDVASPPAAAPAVESAEPPAEAPPPDPAPPAAATDPEAPARKTGKRRDEVA